MGGPNKIIYQILKQTDYKLFEYRYLSKHFDKIFNCSESEIDIKNDLSIRRKIGEKLHIKSELYRYLVSSHFYLKSHFYLSNRYFEKKVRSSLYVDIIHSHDIMSFRNFNNSKLKKILTIHSKGPIINEMSHLITSNKILLKELQQLNQDEFEAVKTADCVTFPSNAALNLFCSEKNINKKKNFKVIYNGVDLESIQAVSSYKLKDIIDFTPDIFILNVSAHVREKNIDKLIRTVEILKEKYHIKPLLINIGQGYLTKDLLRLVDEKELNKEIKFFSYCNNIEIIALMKACDIYIMVSENVVFDMVILEALASGATVLASNNGGNKEVLTDSINGYLLENTEPEYVAEKIYSASKISHEIACKSVSNFTIQKMTKQYEELYNELI